jgi:adenylyl- and sulfurtransferase ThiI
MERWLATNIRILLEKIGFPEIDVFIHKSWARLIISLETLPENPEKEKIIQRIVSSIAMYVAGITSISPVTSVSSDLEDIKKVALELAKENIKSGSSFAVRARRIGKHDYTSQELERLVGEVIFESLAKKSNLTVNLTKPDYTLSIEVKDDSAFIFDQKIPGIGGLPQGTHGTIYTILRGSIEDAIAGFLLSKRGSNVIPVVFTLDNSTFGDNSKGIEKQLEVFNLLQNIRQFIYYKVDFNQILQDIKIEKLQCSTCDKLCIGLVEKITKDKRTDGISLGNAKDTITNRIPEKSKNQLLPVYYPMISLIPEQIVNPFFDKYSSEFCLNTCPGFENQKKKEIKPPSMNEIEQIVANANFSFIKPSKS